MRKTNLKDKIEDNELDLSLNELSEVPVQELAEATKAIYLDLSCNKISKLPDNFASLTHLVKLDLSKNQLIELPYNFGNLTNLQYLDFYGNHLTTLPVSFYRLKNLKWLDLKNNPLDPVLKPIAGDCLDPKQCYQCAIQVVTFMQSIESEIERQKQLKLKEEREKEAARKKKEDKDLERQRRIKKAEKERRRAEAKARKAAEAESQNNVVQEPQTPSVQSESNIYGSSKPVDTPAPASSSGWATFWGFWVFLILISGSFVLALLCYRVYYERENLSIDSFLTTYEEMKVEFVELLDVWWHAFGYPYFLSFQDTLKNWINSTI